MKRTYVRRQLFALLVALVAFGYVAISQSTSPSETSAPLSETLQKEYFGEQTAREVLGTLPVKGRAPKTGYARTQFGNGWTKQGLCDTRNSILKRDMADAVVDESCHVQSGTLNDPYTGQMMQFTRGAQTSQLIQIDHVVALSDAWQKGAQQLSEAERVALANDPLNLLAVEGKANQSKSNGDAATWLPPNKPFRCQYVARQIAVKKKYRLWVTEAEKGAMEKVLGSCSS